MSLQSHRFISHALGIIILFLWVVESNKNWGEKITKTVSVRLLLRVSVASLSLYMNSRKDFVYCAADNSIFWKSASVVSGLWSTKMVVAIRIPGRNLQLVRRSTLLSTKKLPKALDKNKFHRTLLISWCSWKCARPKWSIQIGYRITRDGILEYKFTLGLDDYTGWILSDINLAVVESTQNTNALMWWQRTYSMFSTRDFQKYAIELTIHLPLATQPNRHSKFTAYMLVAYKTVI